MLVYHLLFAVAVDYDRKVVKSTHDAAQLETIDQVNRHWHGFFADLVQKGVLDVDRLLQNYVPPKVVLALVYSILCTEGSFLLHSGEFLGIPPPL
jgi:hypothetical protein